LFARFLFPPYLPQAMAAVVAALPPVPVIGADVAPLAIVARCAANIHPLRHLAVEARVGLPARLPTVARFVAPAGG
jgi:hypothetical protein